MFASSAAKQTSFTAGPQCPHQLSCANMTDACQLPTPMLHNLAPLSLAAAPQHLMQIYSQWIVSLFSLKLSLQVTAHF